MIKIATVHKYVNRNASTCMHVGISGEYKDVCKCPHHPVGEPLFAKIKYKVTISPISLNLLVKKRRQALCWC